MDLFFCYTKNCTKFLSSFNLLITPERKSFTAEIIKGNFKMDNLQFSAIPDNKLEDITYFKIPKIELEINDFFFDGTLTEFPKINRLKTNFKVRNFDLKLPEGLIEEPEIKRIFKDLGIRNNSIKIRLLQFDINMINELTGIIEIKIHTPFLKIDINANLVLRQNGTIQPKSLLANQKSILTQ